MRSSTTLALAMALLTAVGAAGDDAPALVMVPAEAPGRETLRVIHDYGERLLAAPVDVLPADSWPSRWRRVPVDEAIAFGPWSTDRPDSIQGPDGPRLWVVALIGPADPAWIDELVSLGVEVLAPASRHALVVAADRSMLESVRHLETSGGRPVIQGAVELPAAARTHPQLLPSPAARGDTSSRGMRILTWPGRGPMTTAVEALMGDLSRDAAWVEARRPIELHGNLAVRSELLAIEPVWNALGFDGSGVVVAHNDSGVDLGHPSLNAVITSTLGLMSWTDTAHGTHTAGLIAGRGTLLAPAEGGGCTPALPGLDRVRGAAPGAHIVTNNLFFEGESEIVDMMAWGSSFGAVVSSNSWGEVGNLGEIPIYSGSAASVDAAVRDATRVGAGVSG